MAEDSPVRLDDSSPGPYEVPGQAANDFNPAQLQETNAVRDEDPEHASDEESELTPLEDAEEAQGN